MSNKPIAMVLGGTYPHRTLITNLQQRGYYTVLIDYLEKPPAKEVADEHVQESTLDKEKVLEIARDRDAKLVISTCIDQANVTVCYVAEKLGLPVPYSYETALSVTNKGLMKEGMIRHGIATSKYIFVKNIGDFDSAGLSFPVAVKPADSNSSKGVRKACDYGELSRFLDDALKISRSDEAIIEGEMANTLSKDVQRKMEPLMGILSRFIVERTVNRYLDSNGKLKYSDVNLMLQEIVDESELLIGPPRSSELKKELEKIIEDYYKEE